MIKYGDVTLQTFDKEYLSPVVAWINNLPKNRIRLGASKITTEKAAEYATGTDKGILFIILTKVPSGFCLLKNIDWKNRRVEIQTFVDTMLPEFLDIEYKAVVAAIKFCFNDLGLNKIYVNILASNILLVKMYEKAGFKQDVRKRQHYYEDGSYHNVLELSILSCDIQK